MPTHASFLYARNIANFLGLLVKDGELAPDFEDEIVAGTCVVRAGTGGARSDGRGPGPGAADRRRTRPGSPGRRSDTAGDRRIRSGDGVMSTGILEFLTVFVLAAFVGIEVINAVPSILHTPLMSGSNAIHGIVLVGTILIMGSAHGAVQITLAFLAVLLATLNIVGGFVVTDRMLEMFKAKPSERATKAPDAAGDSTDRRCPVTLNTWIDLVYLLAAVGFILALKGLSSPKHARNGNLLAAAAAARGGGLDLRLPAGAGPLAEPGPHAGGHGHRRGHRRAGRPQGEDDGDAPDGGHLQRRGRRGRRPGLHGGRSSSRRRRKPAVYRIVEVLFGVLVGCVSFAGSAIAFAKLQELMTGRPVTYPAQQVINAIVGLAIVALAVATW